MQFRNVEREPMNCRMELNQSCQKEDRCSIPEVQYLYPRECNICTYICIAGGWGEVLLQGFGGVLSPCFLLKITSNHLFFGREEPSLTELTLAALSYSQFVSIVVQHIMETVTFQAGVMVGDAIACSRLFPLGQMMGTAAPVLSSACMAPSHGRREGCTCPGTSTVMVCGTDTKGVCFARQA